MRLDLWNAAFRSSVVACASSGNGRQRGRSIEVWFVGLDLRKWVPIPIRGSGGGWRAVDGRAPSP